MIVIAIIHFVYLLLTLSLFLYSIKTQKLTWLSKKVKNFFLLQAPAFITGIILSFNQETIDGKILIITSPIYTILIGILVYKSYLKRKVMLDK